MKYTSTSSRIVGAVLVASCGTLAACTMKGQDAPSLTGPSEFAQSITVGVSPDVLSQDGASQSTVTVTARGPAGEPLRNLSLHAEIRIDGHRADFGSLSARSLITNAEGRATVVYTSPSAPASPIGSTLVGIAVIPAGNDFANAEAREATIRLVPPNVLIPPDGLVPAFDVVSENRTIGQSVLFDASKSQSSASTVITGYDWSFGDGRIGSGKSTSHAYTSAGSYVVRLTITDSIGRRAETGQLVTIGSGADPKAEFAFSPGTPAAGQAVFFNASASTAEPGRTIASYQWDYGNGVSGSGVQTNTTFSAAGTYNVTLTVTDNLGQKGTVTKAVVVQ